MKKRGLNPFEDDLEYQPQEFLRKALLAFQQFEELQMQEKHYVDPDSEHEDAQADNKQLTCCNNCRHESKDDASATKTSCV